MLVNSIRLPAYIITAETPIYSSPSMHIRPVKRGNNPPQAHVGILDSLKRGGFARSRFSEANPLSTQKSLQINPEMRKEYGIPQEGS
jgi:hypothetical protein